MPGNTMGGIPSHMIGGVNVGDGSAFKDEFVDAEGTALTSHAPGGGFAWVNAIGSMLISSNEASTDADAQCVLDTGISDNVRIRTTRMVTCDNFTGFTIRYSDSNNYIIAGADAISGRWTMWKNVAGAFTNIAAASDSDIPITGDTILNFEVWCSSIDIAIYEDGELRLKSTADSFNDGATIMGLYIDLNVASVTSFDDFFVYRIADGLTF